MAKLVYPDSHGTENWHPVWIDAAPSTAEQIAFGLNSPAALSTLLLFPFDSSLRDGASKELAEHAVMVVFVPLFWFALGKRLDRRGYPSRIRPSLVMRLLVWVGLASVVVTAILILVAMVARIGEIVLGRILILVWATLGIVLWSRAVRRWRTLPNA